ncbi:MAG TPA: YmdB family metallophosphoesterase, partial [Terriglobales bacterium]|nr:YmdB family metallophosphoesterase [Terriglobales bacterium]
VSRRIITIDDNATEPHVPGGGLSVIGVKKELVIARFLNNMPARFEAATGDVRLCGVIVECDDSTGHARSIDRVMVR